MGAGYKCTACHNRFFLQMLPGETAEELMKRTAETPETPCIFCGSTAKRCGHRPIERCAKCGAAMMEGVCQVCNG